jgi:hypothetical protein
MAWSLVEDLVGQAVDGLPVVQGLAAVVLQVLVADVAPSGEPGGFGVAHTGKGSVIGGVSASNGHTPATNTMTCSSIPMVSWW